MQESRTANQVVLNCALGLNRISIRAAIQVPDTSVGVELMTVVKSPVDFFQSVRRELGSSPVVDELDDQRVVDLESSCKPGRDANPFVNGSTQ